MGGVECLSDILSDVRGVANTNIYNMSLQVGVVDCLSDILSDVRGVANTNIYNMSLTGGRGGVSE